MNKLTRVSTLGIAALATLALLAIDTNTAEARGFGIHLGGRNVHLDIGNPHGYGGHARHISYRSAPTYHQTPHYDYHDTSHYDYHPGGYVRHGNHFDYQRGHFDFHRQGHYDFHGGGHGGGHHGGHH